MKDDGGFNTAVASIRIVYIDHYMLSLSDYSSSLHFHAARLRLEGGDHSAKLPVVRIFGSTPAGQKACLHLHGALPYMYLPVPDGMFSDAAVAFAQKLRNALEAALRAVLQVEAAASVEKHSDRIPPAIASLEPVLKTSIYGYHHPSLFLHLKAYNPRTIHRIADILAQGGLPGELTPFHLQPYESHIPFHLQVLTDLSLVGMGYVNLKSCRFRVPLPAAIGNKVPEREFARPNVNRKFYDGMQNGHEHLVWPFAMARRSSSELELDAFMDDVLNAHKVEVDKEKREGPGGFVSKSLRILWEEERLRTGCTPIARKEESRELKAGPDCTDPYLRRKVQALANGQVPPSAPVRSITPNSGPRLSQKSGQNNTQESMQSKELLSSIPSSFEDVFRFLDGDAIADDTSADENNRRPTSPRCDPILDSDGEIAEEEDALSQWADIAHCTQTTDEIKPIPQGDAPGDPDEKIEPREETKSSKWRRRSKRAQKRVALTVQEAPPIARSSAARVFEDVNEKKNQSSEGGSIYTNVHSGMLSQSPTGSNIRIGTSQGQLPQRKLASRAEVESVGVRNADDNAALESLQPELAVDPRCTALEQNDYIVDQLADFEDGKERIPTPKSTSRVISRQPLNSSPRKMDVSGDRNLSQVQVSAKIRISTQKTQQADEISATRLHATPERVLLRRNEVEGVPAPRNKHTPVAVLSKSEFAPGSLPVAHENREYNADHVSDIDEEVESTPQEKTVVRFSSRPWSSPPHNIEVSPPQRPAQVSEVKNLIGIASRQSSVPKFASQESDSTKRPDSSPRSSHSTPLPLTQPEQSGGKSTGRSRRLRVTHDAQCIGPQSPADFIRPARKPPSLTELRKAQPEHGVPSVVHTPAFYGNRKDAPQKPEVFAGVTFKIPVGGLENKPTFISDFRGEEDELPSMVSHIIPVRRPPSTKELRRSASSGAAAGGIAITQRVKIDSAGRQVQLNNKNALGFESMSQDSNAAVAPGDSAGPVKRRVVRGSSGMDSDSDDSSLGEGSLVFSIPRESPAAKSRTGKSVIERPPSPKYDEKCFYEGIASSQDSDRRHSSRMESGAKSQTAGLHSNQNLTYVAMEILSSCIGKLQPDPSRNPILAICAVVVDTREHIEHHSAMTLLQIGGTSRRLSPTKNIQAFASESALLDGLVALFSQCDPDVIIGFETQTASIGYILERAAAIGHHLPRSITRDIEREKVRAYSAAGDPAQDSAAAKYFRSKGVNVTVRGRHILNLWRIVRSEVKLACYSAEGVALELLHTRLPRHTPADLGTMLRSAKTAPRALSYLCRRTEFVVDVVEKLDVLGRTGELARVFGVDFMSVLTRGSQFRVESMMARVAHERDFVLLAAQKEQVFAQPAVESLPLVMEPMSALYVDPVIVLDFQSLYPSMIIAHNLCFSTMMGNINRIQTWGEPRHLGVVKGYKPPELSSLGDKGLNGLFVAPNGEAFSTAEVRRGILPQMLDEILTTRIMVKAALKSAGKDDATIARLLNSRQFGLKMIANVTYGYASASFSGRMPCANLADAIVQCGRDALEKMIDFVDNELNEETGASVVYGDTDSLFVKVPGATLGEAFGIGERIVARSLELFPVPVRLQLEKVYMPCVLQAKKRYVGYSYESPDQAVPIFDAKGIEIVRRDSCDLVQKSLERAIRVLFETRDISHVKRSMQRIFQRVLSNQLPLSSYIFRKEVKLGSYKEGHLPPAAIVATRAMEKDPRAAPRYGERVPFVVIYAGSAATLRDSVVSPEAFQLAERDGLARINATYYITKQIIPALDRVFCLIGVRVASWFAELPRTAFPPLGAHPRSGGITGAAGVAARNSLYRYYASAKCALCRGRTLRNRICSACADSEAAKRDAYFVLVMRTRRLEQKISDMRIACAVCVGVTGTDPAAIECGNLSCDIKLSLNASDLRLQGCRDALNDENFW